MQAQKIIISEKDSKLDCRTRASDGDSTRRNHHGHLSEITDMAPYAPTPYIVAGAEFGLFFCSIPAHPKLQPRASSVSDCS